MTCPLSTFPYDFIFLSRYLLCSSHSILLYSFQTTEDQNSQIQSPIFIKSANSHMSVHQKNTDLSPEFKTPVSISSLNSMELQVDLPQEQNNTEFHQLSWPPSSDKRGQHFKLEDFVSNHSLFGICIIRCIGRLHAQDKYLVCAPQ